MTQIRIYFTFSLLTFYFKEFFLIIPYFISFLFFWSFFLKNNFLSVRLNPLSNDVLKNSNFMKKVHYTFFLNWIYINYFFIFLFFYFLKFDYNLIWFNHLILNNFNLNLIFIVLIVFIFSVFITKNIKNSNINYNIDYFFSILNLSITVPLIFLSNTVYTFLFVLELTSLIILYKFSVSRVWFDKKNSLKFSRVIPKSYLNMLFFQYWANFFSSMLIMFSIFNLIFIYGSSDWSFLNFIFNSNNFFYFSKPLFLIYIVISFLIGFFLKIGFTPLHLFKIEVYKGIPFISLFFYTTWYFLSFFLYFVIILFYNLFSLKTYFSPVLFIFLLLGLFYSIILLFDVNLFKSFFAYSTVVNVLNFLIVLYLNLS